MTKQKFIMGGVIVMLVVLQLFDIVIHAATDQLEIIRVASNVIIPETSPTSGTSK